MSSPPAPPPRPVDARARIAALRARRHGSDSGAVHPGGAPVGGWVPDRRPRHGTAIRRARHAALRAAAPPRATPTAAPGQAARHAAGPAAAPQDAGASTADRPSPVGADEAGVTDAPGDPSQDARDGASGDTDASGAAPDRPAWAARMVRRGPWGALAERWVPEPLRGARVDPGRRGAVLLSLVAALAAIAAAVGVWWSRPEPRPVAPVALAPASTGVQDSASAAAVRASGRTAPVAGVVAGTDAVPAASSPPADSPPSSPAPTGPMLVSVTGQVRHPGVVTVPAGARVADAIRAAGGPLDAADLTGLNLAAHLSDGDSVVVGGPAGGSVQPESTAAPAVPPGTPASSGASAPIDLNTADEAALEQLPGVGPVTAAAIVSWRTDHGPFTSVEQLQAVSGIGPATYAKIAPHATV